MTIHYVTRATDPFTHGGKYVMCQGCGFTAVCTPACDFFVRADEWAVPAPLYCERCVLKPRDAGHGIHGRPLGPLALPCHLCGVPPVIGGGYWGHGIVCDGCYDGAADAPNRGEYVDAATTGAAVIEWNEMQDEPHHDHVAAVTAVVDQAHALLGGAS